MELLARISQGLPAVQTFRSDWAWECLLRLPDGLLYSPLSRRRPVRNLVEFDRGDPASGAAIPGSRATGSASCKKQAPAGTAYSNSGLVDRSSTAPVGSSPGVGSWVLLAAQSSAGGRLASPVCSQTVWGQTGSLRNRR